jgi:hypothetical protein
MDDSPVSHPLSSMVAAAQFFSREEAEAMAALAMEAGIVTPIVDAGRATSTFDMSMGAVGSTQGFTVFVNPADVEKLRAKLGETLEIDPHDPLCTLSAADLRELISAPLNANLTEQVIAAKLLAARGDGEPDPALSREPVATVSPDPHRDSDARTGRWLGGITLVFTILYLWAFLLATPWVRERLNIEGVQGTWQKGASGRHGTVHRDQFSGGVRVPMVCTLPTVASGVLIFSRRKLAGGSVRPMFPHPWRALGWVSLFLSLMSILWFFIREFAMELF